MSHSGLSSIAHLALIHECDGAISSTVWSEVGQPGQLQAIDLGLIGRRSRYCFLTVDGNHLYSLVNDSTEALDEKRVPFARHDAPFILAISTMLRRE